MKSQKGIIYLGLVLVLLVLGIGALGYVMYKTNSLPVVTTSSPTPEAMVDNKDEMEEWQTYSNFGFTFKYPSELISSNCRDGLQLFNSPEELITSQYCEQPPYGEISLVFSKNPIDTGFSLSTDFSIQTTDISISGIPAKRIVINKLHEAPGPDFQIQVGFVANETNFLITLRNKNLQNTFDQILSTFEFVGQDNPRTTWKTYTDPTYNFTINYPASYSVSGQLAANLQDWKAAKGITISSPNNPAKPEVFIEAVFDGYGPIFPTGNINASFSGNKLVVSLDKKDDQEYKQMVDNGLVLSGNELYLSKIIHHGDIPFWFQIKHKDRGNTELDNELKEILSTFQFNK